MIILPIHRDIHTANNVIARRDVRYDDGMLTAAGSQFVDRPLLSLGIVALLKKLGPFEIVGRFADVR